MRAFSLIEVTIVVAIAGIVAALAVPSLSQMVGQERSRSELARLVSAIEQARHTARIRVCDVLLTVDPTVGSITLAPDPVDPDVPCRSLPGETMSFDKNLLTLSAFTIGGVATNPLRFNAEGGISTSARALMTITTRSGPRVVEVWPAAGAVRLK